MTGQGGWPMTVFLTPQGRPFYAGTYFPPSPRHGMPSFPQLLGAIGDAWRTQRDEVEAAGGRIATALAGRFTTASEVPDDAALTAAVHALAADEDAEHGGFGGAPKFPPSVNLAQLVRHAARRSAGPDGAEDVAAFEAGTGAVALGLAGRTLRAMARSGMYDQLAGGFARYAVDAGWVVPHFEKMLYDNAQLARVYLHWWRVSGDPGGPDRPRDVRLDGRGAGHRAGRLRELPGRRHARAGRRRPGARRRGAHLRVDSRAAARRARRAGRSLDGSLAAGDPAGHLRARPLDAAARPRRLARSFGGPALGAGARQAAGRPGATPATGP